MHLGSSGVLTPLKKFVKYANTCAQGDTLGGVGTFTKEVVFAGLRWVEIRRFRENRMPIFYCAGCKFLVVGSLEQG